MRTPDGKIRLVPEAFPPDLPRLEHWLDIPPDDTLRLIGRRHIRSNNSWMHNIHSLVKGPDRAQLQMHPEDAARLGLKSGDRVRIRSRTGVITARLMVTEDVMPGVVSLPHGYGHAQAAETLRIAGALEGASVNEITDEEWIEPVLGTSILNGVVVRVERK